MRSSSPILFLMQAGSASHWADDAEATRRVVAGVETDWLITDHYAIDFRWHAKLRGAVRRIMAIDDLADRAHDADLLLDQSDPTETAARYRDLVPRSCVLLLGPRYALLRSEFAKLGGGAEARSREPPRLFVALAGATPKIAPRRRSALSTDSRGRLPRTLSSARPTRQRRTSKQHAAYVRGCDSMLRRQT